MRDKNQHKVSVGPRLSKLPSDERALLLSALEGLRGQMDEATYDANRECLDHVVRLECPTGIHGFQVAQIGAASVAVITTQTLVPLDLWHGLAGALRMMPDARSGLLRFREGTGTQELLRTVMLVDRRKLSASEYARLPHSVSDVEGIPGHADLAGEPAPQLHDLIGTSGEA